MYVSVTITGSYIKACSKPLNSKVGHCACGPAGLSDLGCGIRFTLLGVRDRQQFPCQIAKETKYWFYQFNKWSIQERYQS